MEAILDKPGPQPMSSSLTVSDRKFSTQTKGRVCVFIDNAMLFHAIRSLYPPGSKLHRHRRLDYVKLKEALTGEDADVRFYYSSVNQPDSIADVEAYRVWAKNNKFIEGVRRLGYTMIGLPLRDRTVLTVNGAQHTYKECGLDCEIIYDMATMSRDGMYDTFVLLASDDAYARTVNRIRQETGIKVTVAFFGQVGCSCALLKEANACLDLGIDLDAIFRPYKTSTV